MIFGYKQLYEEEKLRSSLLELELKQVNDMMRVINSREMTEVRVSLAAAMETIATLKSLSRRRGEPHEEA